MNKLVKRISVILTGVAVGISLTACGASSAESSVALKSSNDEVVTYYATLPDGNKVDCIVYDSRYSGGINCLWGEASVATETTSELTSSIEPAASRDIVCVEWDSRKAGGLDCNISGNW